MSDLEEALKHAVVFLDTLETALSPAEESQRQAVIRHGRDALRKARGYTVDDSPEARARVNERFGMPPNTDDVTERKGDR